MVGQITGKMFDHPIEKDCVSDLSDPGSCRIGPVRQDAGPENAAIQNLAALQDTHALSSLSSESLIKVIVADVVEFLSQSL